jgi:glycolate oxidase
MFTPTILKDFESLKRVNSDRSGFVPSTLPEGVVVATSIDDVVATLQHASNHRIPVVTRGAGSGLAGGSSASQGEIVLDVGSMNSILELDPLEQLIRVQPGILNSAVSEAAKPHGLFYAPDPASMTYCSIGGNIATNAGGMRCAKYGVTRESVLGLTVVLADGSVVKTGGRTIKRVSGYDLTALLIGSEGTLGVVVEATLRLRPLPRLVATLSAYFSDAVSAAQCASAIVSSGVQPMILELMDGKTLDAIDDDGGTDHGTQGRSMIIVQTDGYGAQAEMDVIREVVASFSDSIRVTTDAEESEALIETRRNAIPAISRKGVAFVGDVGVPRAHLGEMTSELVRIGEETGVDIYTIAHAGDGNLHPILALRPEESIDSGAPKAAMDQMFWVAHRLGGTLTGEHGIGLLKREWLVPELGEINLDLLAKIKEVFDPLGILNPGKAIIPAPH